MKRLSTAYQVMLLVALVLAVYYPTLFGEICLVDDLGAISGYFSAEHISFIDIFRPRNFSAGYYRPLIGLSYWLDKELWFLDERLLHFEGVVAHLFNGLLVFYISRKAVSQYLQRYDTYLPLAASLLFSLHPIATESANWISGRTDLMMSTFVLFSVYCLLHYLQNKSTLPLLFAFLSAGMAVLAKEAAFGYLIGLPLLLTLRPSDNSVHGDADLTSPEINYKRFLVYYVCASLAALFLGSYWLVLLIAILYYVQLVKKSGTIEKYPFVIALKWPVIIFLTLTVTIGFALLLRKIAFSSSVGKIGQTITLMGSDLNYTISLFLGAIGFYVKKFFIPMPLNFFILEIDPLYDFIGIAVLFIVTHVLLTRTLPAVMAIIGLFLMLPALPFAFGTIAWTAYAERYIYLSSAFWIIAICLSMGKYLQHDGRLVRAVTVSTVMLCLLCAAVTNARNLVWRTNVALMRDTVAKSPKVRKLRDIYIDALLKAGRADEAKKEYRLAEQLLPAPHYDDRADVMIGSQLVKEKNYAGALIHYEKALRRTNYSSEPLLVAMVHLLRLMKRAENITKQELCRLDAEEQGYATRLYRMTKNPTLLIEAGTIAMQRGLLSEADSYYETAQQNSPQHDRLYALAKRLKQKVRGN